MLTVITPSNEASGWANHWIAIRGVDPEACAAATSRLALSVRAYHNEYMRGLERANQDLRAINVRLARESLGVHDAAAASVIRKLEDRIAQSKAEATEARLAERHWKDIADGNDWARRRAEQRLAQPRYRAVDAVRSRLLQLPANGSATALEWASKAVRLAGGLGTRGGDRRS